MLQKILKLINENLQKHSILLDITDAKLKALNKRLAKAFKQLFGVEIRIDLKYNSIEKRR